MLRAILCELEGVLVQTTGQRRAAMSRAIASLGGSLPDDWRSEITEPPIVPADAEHALSAAGIDSNETNIDLAGIAASRFFMESVSANGVILAPGAINLVREAAAQVRLALVTRAAGERSMPFWRTPRSRMRSHSSSRRRMRREANHIRIRT